VPRHPRFSAVRWLRALPSLAVAALLVLVARAQPASVRQAPEPRPLSTQLNSAPPPCSGIQTAVVPTIPVTIPTGPSQQFAAQTFSLSSSPNAIGSIYADVELGGGGGAYFAELVPVVATSTAQVPTLAPTYPLINFGASAPANPWQPIFNSTPPLVMTPLDGVARSPTTTAILVSPLSGAVGVNPNAPVLPGDSQLGGAQNFEIFDSGTDTFHPQSLGPNPKLGFSVCQIPTGPTVPYIMQQNWIVDSSLPPAPTTGVAWLFQVQTPFLVTGARVAVANPGGGPVQVQIVDLGPAGGTFTAPVGVSVTAGIVNPAAPGSTFYPTWFHSTSLSPFATLARGEEYAAIIVTNGASIGINRHGTPPLLGGQVFVQSGNGAPWQPDPTIEAPGVALIGACAGQSYPPIACTYPGPVHDVAPIGVLPCTASEQVCQYVSDDPSQISSLECVLEDPAGPTCDQQAAVQMCTSGPGGMMVPIADCYPLEVCTSPNGTAPGYCGFNFDHACVINAVTGTAQVTAPGFGLTFAAARGGFPSIDLGYNPDGGASSGLVPLIESFDGLTWNHVAGGSPVLSTHFCDWSPTAASQNSQLVVAQQVVHSNTVVPPAGDAMLIQTLIVPGTQDLDVQAVDIAVPAGFDPTTFGGLNVDVLDPGSAIDPITSPQAVTLTAYIGSYDAVAPAIGYAHGFNGIWLQAQKTPNTLPAHLTHGHTYWLVINADNHWPLGADNQVGDPNGRLFIHPVTGSPFAELVGTDVSYRLEATQSVILPPPPCPAGRAQIAYLPDQAIAVSPTAYVAQPGVPIGAQITGAEMYFPEYQPNQFGLYIKEYAIYDPTLPTGIYESPFVPSITILNSQTNPYVSLDPPVPITFQNLEGTVESTRGSGALMFNPGGYGPIGLDPNAGPSAVTADAVVIPSGSAPVSMPGPNPRVASFCLDTTDPSLYEGQQELFFTTYNPAVNTWAQYFTVPSDLSLTRVWITVGNIPNGSPYGISIYDAEAPSFVLQDPLPVTSTAVVVDTGSPGDLGYSWQFTDPFPAGTTLRHDHLYVMVGQTAGQWQVGVNQTVAGNASGPFFTEQTPGSGFVQNPAVYSAAYRIEGYPAASLGIPPPCAGGGGLPSFTLNANAPVPFGAKLAQAFDEGAHAPIALSEVQWDAPASVTPSAVVSLEVNAPDVTSGALVPRTDTFPLTIGQLISRDASGFTTYGFDRPIVTAFLSGSSQVTDLGADLTIGSPVPHISVGYGTDVPPGVGLPRPVKALDGLHYVPIAGGSPALGIDVCPDRDPGADQLLAVRQTITSTSPIVATGTAIVVQSFTLPQTVQADWLELAIPATASAGQNLLAWIVDPGSASDPITSPQVVTLTAAIETFEAGPLAVAAPGLWVTATPTAILGSIASPARGRSPIVGAASAGASRIPRATTLGPAILTAGHAYWLVVEGDNQWPLAADPTNSDPVGRLWAAATPGGGFSELTGLDLSMRLIGELSSAAGVPNVRPPLVFLARGGPSPFRTSYTLFWSGAVGHVDISILDVAGRVVRHVRTLSNGGSDQWQWHGESESGGSAAPGIYFVRVRTEQGHLLVRRAVLVR